MTELEMLRCKLAEAKRENAELVKENGRLSQMVVRVSQEIDPVTKDFVFRISLNDALNNEQLFDAFISNLKDIIYNQRRGR